MDRYNLPSQTILVVDDIPENLDLISTILRSEGYELETADSGPQALEKIQNKIPDLILLDVMMPGMDGYEACRLIKANPNHAQIPIIFLSALSNTLDKIAGFEVGAVDFIAKPIHEKELLARVNNHLEVQLYRKGLESQVKIRTYELEKRTQELEQITRKLHEEIEERKQVETQLRRAQSTITNIVDSMHSIVVGVDRFGNITHWNRSAEQATQISCENAIGLPLKDLLREYNIEESMIMEAVNQKKPTRIEKLEVVLHGETRFIDFAIYPYVTGDVEGAVMRIHDITSRVQLEQEVLESKDRFLKVLEEKVKERTLELEASNRSLTNTIRTLRTAQSQLVQSGKMAALGQLIAGVAHEINTPLGAIRSSAHTIQHSINKTLLYLPSLSAQLTHVEKDSFRKLIEISLDNQHPQTMKEQRVTKRTIAKELAANFGEQASVMAEWFVKMRIYDDLKPFYPLLSDPWWENTLETAYKMTAVQRSCQTIVMATERASKTLFALKNYSSTAQKGGMERIRIIDGIETVLTLYQYQIRHGVDVQREYGEIPDLLCLPDELNQVWTNLIQNALHAMKFRGLLQIKTELVGHHVHVTFIDNGIGIPEEIQEKIFDPFFTTKPQGEGTGLGLDIARQVIEKHGGTISATSTEGRTEFCVKLPVR